MINLTTFLPSPSPPTPLSEHIYMQYICSIYIHIHLLIDLLSHGFDLLSSGIFPQVIHLSFTLLLPKSPLHFMTYTAGIYIYFKVS